LPPQSESIGARQNCFENPRRPRNLPAQFMSNIPSDLKYAKSHEWARVSGDTATVGITDHAQQELTDIVFVELPAVGRKVKAGEACAVVESVKTASDIYSPVSGEITAVNPAVVDNPALVNTDPHAAGWFYKIKLSNAAELNALLSPADYQKQIGG
jgi:glycine cleavage system H protein